MSRSSTQLSMAVLVTFCLLNTSTMAAESYDFADGTLQGWSKGHPLASPFTADLNVVVTSDTPVAYMQAVDIVAGGGIIGAQAPASLSGDLTRLISVSWKELLPVSAVVASRISFDTSNGTYFRSDLTRISPHSVWSPRSVSFESGEGWIRHAGTSDFMTALANVTHLYIELDVSGSLGPEAAVAEIEFADDSDVATESVTFSELKVLYSR
jgi:hypothetical protein